MAISREENDLLTRVESGAPMGEMIRQHYWLPAIPSDKLEADGAPVRVRLLGNNYAAFRTTDGTAGIIDERCPHRHASMLLARNEDNGLRCIYHGWKLDVHGNVTEAPNQVGNQRKFCENVRVNRYRVEERGGIVWVWLGQGERPPLFPDLPFTRVPAEQVIVGCQEVATNWLQGVEASVDTSHVGVLHSTNVALGARSSGRVHMTKVQAPVLEFEDRPYGYRYAALRDLGNGKTYVRLNNFVMPWFGIICAPEEGANSNVFFSTPVDDTTHRAWIVQWNPTQPLGVSALMRGSDSWNWPPLPPGGPENNWGQDRKLMKMGHFTGFPQSFATEDFAMFLGQGPIHDRTDEQLSSADGAVVRLRRQLLKSVREFMDGQTPELADNPELDYATAVSVGGVIEAGRDWRRLAAD